MLEYLAGATIQSLWRLVPELATYMGERYPYARLNHQRLRVLHYLVLDGFLFVRRGHVYRIALYNNKADSRCQVAALTTSSGIVGFTKSFYGNHYIALGTDQRYYSGDGTLASSVPTSQVSLGGTLTLTTDLRINHAVVGQCSTLRVLDYACSTYCEEHYWSAPNRHFAIDLQGQAWQGFWNTWVPIATPTPLREVCMRNNCGLFVGQDDSLWRYVHKGHRQLLPVALA
jgi:hypothetical protein